MRESVPAEARLLEGNPRMKTRALVSALCVSLACPGIAGAQAGSDWQRVQTRKEVLFPPKQVKDDPNACTIQGLVTDAAQNPVDGAVVRLKDMKSLTTKSVTTGKDGLYRFTGLSKVIDYEVWADAGNMISQTKKLSMYDTERVAVRNLKLTKRADSKKEASTSPLKKKGATAATSPPPGP